MSCRRTHNYFSLLSNEEKHKHIFRNWKFLKGNECNENNENKETVTVVKYKCKDAMCDLSRVMDFFKITINNKDKINVIGDIVSDIQNNQDDYLPHLVDEFIIKSGTLTVKMQRENAIGDSTVGIMYTSSLPSPIPNISDLL